MINDFNLKIKNDLRLLIERSFSDLQRGSSVLQALYSAVEQLNDQVSSQLISFFENSKHSLKMGSLFTDLLDEAPLFQNTNLQFEKKLFEKSYLHPEKAKMEWINCMRGSDPTPWNKNPAFKFIRTYLAADKHLWIVGESINAITQIANVLQTETSKTNFSIFSNDNYESIRLNCKRGIQTPENFQLILWVDESSSGEPLITALDENIGRITPGSCDFTFVRIFYLGHCWNLKPTGHIPSVVESFDSNHFNNDIFNTSMHSN